ncbi:hypothetical protein T484DRAFT_1803592, partial [Baffinella frigidus]
TDRVASFFLKNCGDAALQGEAAARAIVVEEHYPADATRHFVLVSNRFNGSTYTTASSMYVWEAGQLHLYQTFPETRGAHSLTHYKMGGMHWLFMANHFDDKGNGFGVPSVIYAYTWSDSANKNVFMPVQSVSTTGAVAASYWEHDGAHYLAIANYFNGSDFSVSSPIYRLQRT